MLRCFTLKPTSSSTTQNRAQPSSPPLQTLENESEASNPRDDETLEISSSQSASTSLNLLSHEYNLAVKTDSYNEIWSKIHHQNGDEQEEEEEEEEDDKNGNFEVISASASVSSATHVVSVSQFLQPNRELINEALHRGKPTNLTRLVSAYFDHSEHTSRLCFLLHQSIDRARSLYSPLLELLHILPLDSNLNQSQCDYAFDVFLQFDLLENPFPQPNSDDNFQDMSLCFSQLKQQLDRRLTKARTQARLQRRFPTRVALCFVTLFTKPRFDLFSSSFARKQLHHIAQLDAASRGTYVLNNDLNTIDRLVTRLHGVVESDKLLVRLGLERGKDRYLIHEVVKQLHKNHTNFLNQLKDLEEHLCLCFATINRARSLLLQQIPLHSNP